MAVRKRGGQDSRGAIQLRREWVRDCCWYSSDLGGGGNIFFAVWCGVGCCQ